MESLVDAAPDRPAAHRQLLLVVGDVASFLLFVVVGRLSHGFTSDWLFNIGRIALPFLLGWGVVAPLVGAYRFFPRITPARFLGRAALAVVVADLVAFALRRFLLGDSVTWPFAITSVLFTALFLLTWRFLFFWWQSRARAVESAVPE